MSSKNTPPTFSGKTRAEWLDIIRSDLKGKDIKSLQAEWLSDLSVSPFQHLEDLSKETQPLARVFQQPKLVESFPINENMGSNLFEALSHGISAPFFPDPTPWASFWSPLKEVQWDMLFPIWTSPLPENSDAPDHPEQYTQRFYLNGPHDENLSYRQQTGRFCFAVPHTSAASLPHRLADWLLDIVHQIDTLEEAQAEQLFKNALHKKNLGRNFYLELAALRAMRILSNQLQKDYNLSQSHPIAIYAHIGPDLALSNLQKSMIAYTTAAWAAVTGGADFIHIDPKSDAEDGLSRRLARNVFHLFDMESHLLHVVDPAAGSYALENLSHTLAQGAWDLFRKSIDEA